MSIEESKRKYRLKCKQQKKERIAALLSQGFLVVVPNWESLQGSLSLREVWLITRFFCLEDLQEPPTFVSMSKDMANCFNEPSVSPQRVRQIFTRAIEKLSDISGVDCLEDNLIELILNTNRLTHSSDIDDKIDVVRNTHLKDLPESISTNRLAQISGVSDATIHRWRKGYIPRTLRYQKTYRTIFSVYTYNDDRGEWVRNST